MTQFNVWAPDAERVALHLDDVTLPMERGERGYWSLDAPQATAGDAYRFVLDGGEPLPDPRSAWQPDGVHGASRLVDHGTFAWTDGGWQPPAWKQAVVYEVHVGTFTEEGTFDAAIERLAYLQALGVTHVELMPVAQFPGERGWGYDGVYLFAPQHGYGGPDGLKRLVDACHERGLAVLLDVVYNHLGPDGNYLGQYGPYFTDDYETPWGEAVNLDGRGSDEVRRFLIDNALMWLRDYHIDGLRLDATDRLYDHSPLHLLEQLARKVEQLAEELGRPLVLTAENDTNDPRLVRRREEGGYGLDAQWLDDFHHALHTTLTGERGGYYADFDGLADLATSLEGAYVYAGRHSAYRGHRRGRRATVQPGSEDGTLLPGTRFVACMQNHDQVGNRAVGDRIGHLVGDEVVKVGAALLLMAPFVPLLFQGEEWAASSPFQFFTDHQDPELGDAVSTGRQTEFGAFGWEPENVPDPQDEETFRRSKLDWVERSHKPHHSMLEWYRALIALRREHPALQEHALDAISVTCDAEARWIVLKRGALAVVAHLGEEGREVDLGAKATHVIMRSSDKVNARERCVQFEGAGVAIVEVGDAEQSTMHPDGG